MVVILNREGVCFCLLPLPWEHWAMSEGTFGCHDVGSTSDIWWVDETGMLLT